MPIHIDARLAVIGLALAGNPAVQAQTGEAFPQRPLRLLVGFPAGGPTDVPARVIAERLRLSLGQPVVVENRPGAAGMLAVHELLARPRDGYELLVCTYIDPVNPVLYRSAKYRLADLVPVSQIVRAYYAAAVRKGFPAQTLAEFAAHAKSNPGKVTFGHMGVGSMPFLAAKQIERLAGLTLTEVSYKGTPPLIQDMAGDRLDFVVGPLVNTMPLVRAGTLKALAVTSPQRLPSSPQIPTLTEQGAALVVDSWLGICGATGMPSDRVRLLNRHVVEAVSSEQFRATAASVGIDPASSSPDALQRLMDDTARVSGGLIKDLGITLD